MEIKQLQELMRDLYFQSDSERGILATFLWFIEEVGELSEMVRKIVKINKSAVVNMEEEETTKSSARAIEKENLQSELKKEFADVLAWLSSLANLLNIDLEEAVMLKYPNSCPKCKQNPCICEK